MADGRDVDLQQQFALLQQQQQEKMKKRMMNKQKIQKTDKGSSDESPAFGVTDDLGLQLADPPVDTNSIYSEELVNHLNDQIRELKDETGRLYKLLSERDLENKKLKRNLESTKAALVGSNDNAPGAPPGAVSGVSNESAATKIVDLSKKVRELTASMESEKTKSRQWAKKCMELENKLSEMSSGKDVKKYTKRLNDDGSERDFEHEMKVLNDRIQITEQKMSEYRNQVQMQKQELRVAYKVLSNEVGEGVNVQSLINAPSGYRGRAQQILALQKKVQELKQLVEQQAAGGVNLEEEMLGSRSTIGSGTSRSSANMQARHMDQIRKMERERKETNEKLANEIKALEADYETMKGKFEASKARSKVLSNENKSLKQQLATLLEKGKHDDELITALMSQQTKLKDMMESTSEKQRELELQKEKEIQKMKAETQQESAAISQLKTIIAEKEARIQQLETEIHSIQNGQPLPLGFSTINAVPKQASFHLHEKSKTPPTPVEMDGTTLTSISNISSGRVNSRSGSRQSVHEGDMSDRPSSRRASSRGKGVVDPQMYEELKLQSLEYKSLCQAAEVERDRLNELVQVLQNREAEASERAIDLTAELQGLRRINVQLEKQVEKMKAEQGIKSGKKSGANHKLRASIIGRDVEAENADTNELENLQTNFEILQDENEALRSALQATVKAKETDLKQYNEIMDEVRRTYLQALKQHLQGQPKI